MKKLIIVVLIITFGCPFPIQAQKKIKLENYKLKLEGIHFGSYEILLSDSILNSDWNNNLSSHLSEGLAIASKKNKKGKQHFNNLIIYFSELKLELDSDFKGYGKGTGVFFFYMRDGEELLKIKSEITVAETKLGYIPRLLLEKALSNLKADEIVQSLQWCSNIDAISDDINRIELLFKPDFINQKPGVYLFFEDLKSNQPFRTLSEKDLANIIPEENYLSVYYGSPFVDKEEEPSFKLKHFWGIFTGKEYLAFNGHVFVKLHASEDNLIYPAYALDVHVVSNPPQIVHLANMTKVLSYGSLGIIDVGISALEANRRRNNPSLDKRFYILNKKYGHFNYTFKEEE